ncbi:MAG: O-antigen ligase family protein [Ruminococcus sp.]|nr:O-antigen ligase family protein [Ruminococcus sp.]
MTEKCNEIEQGDRKISNFISVYFLFEAINLLVKLWIGEPPMWGMISKGILAFFLFQALIVVAKRKILSLIGSEVLFAILFFCEIMMDNIGDTDIYSIIFHSLCVYLPLGICTYCIDNYEILLKRLYLLSWPTSFILIGVSLNVSVTAYDYYMSLGYAFIPQIFILWDRCLHSFKWYDFVLSVINVSLCLAVGSRGPILCLGIFVLLAILCSDFLSLKKKICIFGSLLIGCVCFILFYKSFFRIVSDILKSFGYSSRTLLLLASGNLSDSGRGEIYKTTIEKIIRKPFMGWGLAGGWTDTIYPHNIFLEFLLSFGIIFGGIISIYFLYLMFTGLMQKDVVNRRLTVIFVSTISCLLISDSFIMHPSFFICVALCRQGKHANRKEAEYIRMKQRGTYEKSIVE